MTSRDVLRRNFPFTLKLPTNELDAYGRYYAVARRFALFARSEWMVSRAARWMAVNCHPQRHMDPPWVGYSLPNGGSYNREHWRRSLILDCYAMIKYYSIRQFVNSRRIFLDDPEDRLALHRRGGGVFLTYHHHFFNHLGPILGELGLATSVITLSYEESPLYPLFDRHLKQPTTNARRLLAGGDLIFVGAEAGANSKIARDSALGAIDAGQNLVMAIDFQNIFAWGRSDPVIVAGETLQLPTGLLRRICERGTPLSTAYLRMHDSGSIGLHVSALPDSAGARGVVDVLAAYGARLDELLDADPAFWEGWHNLVQNGSAPQYVRTQTPLEHPRRH